MGLGNFDRSLLDRARALPASAEERRHGSFLLQSGRGREVASVQEQLDQRRFSSSPSTRNHDLVGATPVSHKWQRLPAETYIQSGSYPLALLGAAMACKPG